MFETWKHVSDRAGPVFRDNFNRKLTGNMIGLAQISQELQKHNKNRTFKNCGNLMCKMSFCEILHLFSPPPIRNFFFFGVITDN